MPEKLTLDDVPNPAGIAVRRKSDGYDMVVSERLNEELPKEQWRYRCHNFEKGEMARPYAADQLEIVVGSEAKSPPEPPAIA